MRLAILAIAVLLAGCAAREPIARTTAAVQLDKSAYRVLVERAGSSSVGIGMGAGASFGSGGQRSLGLGLGISFQLTTEVQLIGLDAENLDRRSFEVGLSWGANQVELPLHHGKVVVMLAGSGPGGRLLRQVGELSAGSLAPAGYRLDVTDPDRPLALIPR